MRSIWHHGAWNRNYGDWVLHDSIQHHLTAAAGRPLRFTPVDSQATVYDADMIERLNAEAEMLVIGGGGLIFNRPQDRSVSGWQFNIRRERLEDIRVPIVVYGIGYNRFPFDPTPFPDILDAHLLDLQQKSTIFSVRNTGTQQELIRRGLDPARLEVVPDAGLFAPARNLATRLPFPGRPLIGVGVAGDRPEHRFPAPAEQNERAAMTALARALGRTCDRLDARVLLIPHIEQIDERFDDTFRQVLGPDRVTSLKHIAPTLYPPGSHGASQLVESYDRCDLVVGMRGHGCILPLGLGKRVVAFGAHRKNAFLLEDLGMSKHAMSHDTLQGGAAAEEEIFRVIMATWSDDAWDTRLATALAAQQKCFENLNRRMAGILQPARRSV